MTDMVWIERDGNHAVIGVFANAQPGYADKEQLASDAPEVVSFLNSVIVTKSSISDRQFFQQLAIAGIISQDEALAAVKTGAIPAAMQALIDAMPTDQQFNAKMIVSGATTFELNHPMTVAIGIAYGWTKQQMADFFAAASKL